MACIWEAPAIITRLLIMDITGLIMDTVGAGAHIMAGITGGAAAASIAAAGTGIKVGATRKSAAHWNRTVGR